MCQTAVKDTMSQVLDHKQWSRVVALANKLEILAGSLKSALKLQRRKIPYGAAVHGLSWFLLYVFVVSTPITKFKFACVMAFLRQSHLGRGHKDVDCTITMSLIFLATDSI